MEKPKLETITYTFTQEGNCVDGRDTEELIIEAKSSLGIGYDEGAFYVLKTDRWAIDDVSEIEDLILKVQESVKLFITEKSVESEVQESEEDIILKEIEQVDFTLQDLEFVLIRRNKESSKFLCVDKHNNIRRVTDEDIVSDINDGLKYYTYNPISRTYTTVYCGYKKSTSAYFSDMLKLDIKIMSYDINLQVDNIKRLKIHEY